MYVYDLVFFLTMQIHEDTPAIVSLGKLCEDHGYTYEWTSGQKPHLIKHGRKYNATRRITFLSLFPACQPDLPARLRVHPQHRYRRTQSEMMLRQVQQPHGGENPVGHGDQLRDSKETENKNKNEDTGGAWGTPRDLHQFSGERSFCLM